MYVDSPLRLTDNSLNVLISIGAEHVKVGLAVPDFIELTGAVVGEISDLRVPGATGGED